MPNEMPKFEPEFVYLEDLQLSFRGLFPEDTHKLRTLSVLGEHPEGITAKQIGKKTGDSRKVVYDYLSELVRSKFVLAEKRTYVDEEDGTLTTTYAYKFAKPCMFTLDILTPAPLPESCED